MGKIRNCFIVIVCSFLLIASILTGPSAAGVGGPNLKVTIIDMSPYPAQIGQYLNLIVQVENVGSERAEDVWIQVVPEYPFSLDSPNEAKQNIGALGPEKIATREFYLYVDKNAKKGSRSIDILAQVSKSAPSSDSSFDLRIGTETFDSKGTVELEKIVQEPEVFMSGDRGSITLTLRNSASEPTVSIDGVDFDTNARVQSATLRSVDGVTVTSAPYGEMGLLGPGDKLDLTFNVRVADDLRDGTYPLELAVEGNSFDYNSRMNVPVRVDSSNVWIIPSKPLELVDGKTTLEFDVANTHPNEFSSVSIKPQVEGVRFYPSEYFIGRMAPDELFTIEFDATAEQGFSYSSQGSASKNLSLVASYSNGVNRHENLVSNLKLSMNVQDGEDNSGVTVAGMLVFLFIPAAVLLYRKKKMKR